MELAFREITVGIHPVVEFEAFVKESGPGVMPSILSEAFLSRIGNDARPASLDISGTLDLVTGERLMFSTRVNIDAPRPLGG